MQSAQFSVEGVAGDSVTEEIVLLREQGQRGLSGEFCTELRES